MRPRSSNRRIAASIGGATILVLAAALTACSKSPATNAGPTDSAPIQIGSYLPLTGPLASTGLTMKAATDAAVQDANAHGGVNGHPIVFTVLDNAYSGPQSVQNARQLASQNNVVAFLGPCCGNQVAATLPFITQQSHIPIVLNTFPGIATWFQPVNPYVFTTQTLNETQAGILGRLAAQKGAKKVAVVYANVAIIQPMASQAAALAQQVDSSVTSEQIAVAIGTTDWTPTVRSLLSNHVEAVVFLSSITDLSNFLTTAKLQGLAVPVYGNATYADTTLFKLAGSAADGTTITSLSYFPEDQSAEMAAFRAAMKKYESISDPTISEVAYYAGAQAFIGVLRKMKTPITAANIASAMNSSGTITTNLMPPLSFSPDKHVGTDQVRLIQVQNGKFVPIGDFTR